MVKNGYKGPVFTTGATAELCGIMLRDSAHIQEFEAEWRNRKAKRSGGEEYQPLYTMQDAEAALALFHEVDYGETVEVGPNHRAASPTWAIFWAPRPSSCGSPKGRRREKSFFPATSATPTSPFCGTPSPSMRRTMW